MADENYLTKDHSEIRKKLQEQLEKHWLCDCPHFLNIRDGDFQIEHNFCDKTVLQINGLTYMYSFNEFDQIISEIVRNL